MSKFVTYFVTESSGRQSWQLNKFWRGTIRKWSGAKDSSL